MIEETTAANSAEPQQRRRRRGAATAPIGGNPKTLAVPKVAAREAPGPRPPVKLYSIFALSRDAQFRGDFNARGADYAFVFAPARAEMKDGKLDLIGRFEVTAKTGKRPAQLNDVRATLLATQGGISASPARRQLQTGTSGTVNDSSPNQRQEQAKAPETSSQPPQQTPATEAGAGGLPLVDATGERGFVAAMYFRLQPLDARALGVPVEMSAVQLNVRLAPESQRERDLFWTYTDLVAAAYGDEPKPGDIDKFTKELNQLLKA